MSEYTISEVHKNDRFTFAQIDKLLEQEGIRTIPAQHTMTTSTSSRREVALATRSGVLP